jgi:hypothetical protein
MLRILLLIIVARIYYYYRPFMPFSQCQTLFYVLIFILIYYVYFEAPQIVPPQAPNYVATSLSGTNLFDDELVRDQFVWRPFVSY